MHQTGTVLGCLRRLQGWSLSAIIDEYRHHAGRVKTRFWNEQYIELFDTDLVAIPTKPAPWFAVHLQWQVRRPPTWGA